MNWSQFEGIAALRCTIGVAIPLLIGYSIDRPVIGVFGAVGALGVGFGSFQGAYRTRAGVMLLATLGMAISVFIGSLAGHWAAATIVVAAVWSFGGGLLVALGERPSYVGLQSIVAVVIAGGFPSDLEGAVGRAALVVVGGLVQTVLVVTIWPLQRFTVERRNLVAVYRSLATYASSILDRSASAPEPHTFANTPSPLDDPQPFSRSQHTFIFQTLLDEAERIRASLAALAIYYPRFEAVDHAGAIALVGLSTRVLTEIAMALEEDRPPRERLWNSRALAGGSAQLSAGTPVEPLLAQLRAASRTARVIAAQPGYFSLRRGDVGRRWRRPGIRQALVTLRANLTLRSTACRHALRLAVILTLAAAAASGFDLLRGYWMPLTIALVLKPEFNDTMAFTIARVGGTVLGAASATAIAIVFAPGPVALIVLVLAFVWGVYAFASANYGAFSVFITGYVVFLMTLAGIPEVAAAADRIVFTSIAGALALAAYVVWPTWIATEVRPAIATMLETQSRYVGSLLDAYSSTSSPDMKTLGDLRASARLARSNAEAVVARMLSEPRSSSSMGSRTATGIVGATRRTALAALSLHAGLEHDLHRSIVGLHEFTTRIASDMLTLAAAIRLRSAPLPLSPLPAPQLPHGTGVDYLLRDETAVIAESVTTIAGLIAKDAAT